MRSVIPSKHSMTPQDSTSVDSLALEVMTPALPEHVHEHGDGCSCESAVPGHLRRQLLKGLLAAPLAAGPCAGAFALAGASRTDAQPVFVDASTRLQQWRQLTARVAGVDNLIERIETFSIKPATMPWQTSLGSLAAGQEVSFFLDGLWWFSKEAGRWLPPGFAFFTRIGSAAGNTPIWNAMQNTGTYRASRGGELQLARSVGEFAGPDGQLWVPEEAYRGAHGQIEGIAIIWKSDARQGLLALSQQGDVDGQLQAELNRLRWLERMPGGWNNFFAFGDGSIFTEIGKGQIDCWTHKNVGILQYPLDLQLQHGTRLNWQWLVQQLPSDQPEDQLLGHDYLSIAVQFDDGQDLTYLWSNSLPQGKVFRCPIPGWDRVETHVVQRTGDQGLGEWLSEQRDVYRDYHAIINGPATRVVAVWLIANSLFTRGFGRCQFRQIAIGPDNQQQVILAV